MSASKTSWVAFLLLPALSGLLPFILPGARAQQRAPAQKVVLVVHGGAGDLPRDKSSPELAKRKEGLDRALQAGYEALRKGRGSLDAVEAAIRVFEDDPWFNAGKGAVFTHDGRNELDASIMEGKGKRAGAVAGVTVVKNPITAARKVLEDGRHVLLAGRGAELFATKQGLEIVDPRYFWTLHRWKELQQDLEKEKKQGGRAPAPPRYFSTVGCVALDRDGNLAAGTSTGGMTNKRTGRVGDSPIIGAGTYADNDACAVSCTGHGEYFIRYAVAHDIAARVKYKRLPVAKAADEVINVELRRVKGEGGAIVLDARGNMAMPFNTERMYRGYVTADGTRHVLLFDEKSRK